MISFMISVVPPKIGYAWSRECIETSRSFPGLLRKLRALQTEAASDV